MGGHRHICLIPDIGTCSRPNCQFFTVACFEAAHGPISASAFQTRPTDQFRLAHRDSKQAVPALRVPAFNAIRDVCRASIHNDARGPCPNRNDVHDLRAPYARDHGHGRRAPEQYRRFVQRRELAAPEASQHSTASASSPMRKEPRHRSAENDSFGISPRGAAIARRRAMSLTPGKFRSSLETH